MPVFRPSLAETSVFLVSPATQAPYVRLSFFATFALREDYSGRWEVWTDLPLLDARGQPTIAPGEWSAIRLLPVEQVLERENEPLQNDVISSMEGPLVRL